MTRCHLGCGGGERMASKSVKVGRLTFKTLKLAAEHFGVHYGNVVRRLNAGWTAEEALGIAKRKRPNSWNASQLKTSQGMFPSIKDAAQHFGLEAGTLQRRLDHGWTPDQAVGISEHKRKSRIYKTFICAGKHYPSSWALARAFGKKKQLVAKRLLLGWTPEQAVELVEAPPRFRNQLNGATNKHWKRIEIVDDKEYPATDLGEYKVYVIQNKVDGKEYVGITINPLWQRFNGHKRSAKMGVKTKLYNAMRHYGAENFEIKLIRHNARSFADLQRQEAKEITKRDAIKNGYNVSPGGAIGTPAAVTVGKLKFPSRGAAAEYFGIGVSVFNLRISRLQWTPEQAAEIEPRGKYARHKTKVAGKLFPSLKKAAEAHGIDYRLVWDRVYSKGWALEQALGISTPPSTIRKRGVSLDAFGQNFPSFAACARHFGIKRQSLQKRVAQYGDGIEDAIRRLQGKPKPGARKKSS